jgi:hypothetical protein
MDIKEMERYMKSFKDYLNENTLEDVHAHAKEKGVSLDIDPHFSKNAYHLQWMDRSKGSKGAGREVLNKLHSHADKNKKEIHLVAHESNPKLVSYYKSQGYKEHGKTDDGTYMIRKPKK